MMSAAEQQLVGWPLPASEVERSESIRSRVAMFLRAGMSAARSMVMACEFYCGRPIPVQMSASAVRPRAADRRRRALTRGDCAASMRARLAR